MEMHLFARMFLVATMITSGCEKSASTQPQKAPVQKSVAPLERVEALPPGHPPLEEGKAALPPGHPPLGNAAGAMPPGHPSIDMSQQALPPGSASDVAVPQWTVPKDWQAGRASSIRKGSFTVTGPDNQTADISVTVFPGDVGGMLNNINRWRSQFGLPPVLPDEVDKTTATIEWNGQKATVVDISMEKAPEGKVNPLKMVVVTVFRDGNSWFYKMTGEAPLVTAQKDALIGFVKSTKF